MKKHLKVLAPLAALALLALAACVPVEDTPLEGGIVIGGLYPLSGGGADYGIPGQRVAEIAVDEINESGGVLGKKFTIVWEDGGCDSAPANTAARKLLDVTKVTVIYGGFCSSETLAAAPLTEAAKAILLSPGSSNPDITNAGDFVFRNYPSDASQGKILAQFAKDKDYKKVGVLSEQQDYTLGIKKVFEENFEGEVVAEDFAKDAADVRTQILKLKGAGVDVYLINPQTPSKADLIFKQLQEQGIKGPLILNDVSIGFQDNVTKYKDFLEGAVGAEATYDRESAQFKNLDAKYKEKFNEELPYPVYMATSYDAVYLLKAAIEAAGGVSDTVKIRDFLYGVKDWKGAAGALTIDQNGDPLTAHLLRVIKAGVVENY